MNMSHMTLFSIQSEKISSSTKTNVHNIEIFAF